jgi:UDP-N-acetylmuramate--alanine ligase
MDIKKAKHIHFSGIKGVGMTALALYAQDMGKTITGSDVAEDFVTSEVLKKRKIPISQGFKETDIPDSTEVLVYSAAHADNPQIKKARKLNIPVLSYAQALAKLTAEKNTIATCGVGGKTTTAAMIATILEAAGFRPGFVVGVGNILNFGVPGRYEEGKYIIVEADEYLAVPDQDLKPKFYYLSPKVIMATNIEHDHPDVYKNIEETKLAFEKFFLKLPANGLLVANLDSKNIQAVVKKLKEKGFSANLITYGFSPQADWRIHPVKIQNQRTYFSVEFNGILADFTLSIPGKFNAANAAAAVVVATHLGVAQKVSIKALEKFQGTKRRFERIGNVKGIEVWDDYAHHPNEIQATLMAARDWFPGKRLIVVFQPHTYSRTKMLINQFAQALSLADEVIITEIYSSAREKKDPSISADMLAQRTAKFQKNCLSLKKNSVIKYLMPRMKKDDVLMTLGAGDIYEVAERLIKSS